MAQITTEIRGSEVFTSLGGIPRALREDVWQELIRCGLQTEAEARINATRGLRQRSKGGRVGLSGGLVQRISTRVDRSSRTIRVGPTVSYAVYVHEGRRPGARQPPLAPILEFVKRKPVKIDTRKERARIEHWAARRIAVNIWKRKGQVGKPPPTSVIVKWARRVGAIKVTRERILRSVAFAIARSIGKRGIKPIPFLRQAWEKTLPRCDEGITRILGTTLDRVVKGERA